MLRAAAVAACLFGAAVLAACGGGASLPDQGQCPEPDPVQLDDSTAASYRTAVAQGLANLGLFEQSFRDAWTSRRLRERDEFREDYARYAHLGRCTADVLFDLVPPTEGLGSFQADLEDFLRRYVDALDDGEGYVASRNRSGYNRWIDDIDELAEELRELPNALRRTSD